jgi:pilus assembly protein CpaE
VLRILELLSDMFGYVVVDTPPLLGELVLQAVASSDAVALVASLDVPSVKDARLGLQAFDLLQVPREKVALVLNRADSKVHLLPRDVEKVLEERIDFAFPSEAAVPQSVNQGQPALLAYPRSRFAAEALAMAEFVLARAEEARKATPAL